MDPDGCSLSVYLSSRSWIQSRISDRRAKRPDACNVCLCCNCAAVLLVGHAFLSGWVSVMASILAMFCFTLCVARVTREHARLILQQFSENSYESDDETRDVLVVGEYGRSAISVSIDLLLTAYDKSAWAVFIRTRLEKSKAIVLPRIHSSTRR